jgi:wyosine [tRNA(Phe)-imidazoG37] synthetase (radical SAM superfamily)
MVAQTEVMVAVAKEAQAVSMADEEPDEKAKEKAKELDEKLVSDMMEEHAAKLREMHAKVTDTQSAATSKLQQRLAQRKQGGKVTPAPMEGVTVDVFPK